MENKTHVNGLRVKQFREEKQLTQDYIVQKAKEEGVDLSNSTLRRIEGQPDFPCKQKVAEFLSQALELPLPILVCDKNLSSQHQIRLLQRSTGAELLECLLNSEGIEVNIIGEPEQREVRECYLNFHKFLNKRYGYNAWSLKFSYDSFRDSDWDISKKYEQNLENTTREYELRDFIDVFGTADYKLFANFYFRYEPYFDPDWDGVKWLGPTTQRQLEQLKERGLDDDPHWEPIIAEGFGFRTVLKISIAKTECNELYATVDFDPGKLTSRNWRELQSFDEWLKASLTADGIVNPHRFTFAFREENEQAEDYERDMRSQMLSDYRTEQ